MQLSKSLILFFSVCMVSLISKAQEQTGPKGAAPEASVQKCPNNFKAQFNGLSLGVNTGFIHLSTKTSWVNHIPGITNNKGGRYSTTGNGGYIGIHAILGHVWPSNCFYLGGELTAAYNFLKGTTKDNVNYGLVFRSFLKDSYTMTLRVGHFAGKALIYVKAGGAVTSRKIEVRYKNSQPLHAWKRTKKYRGAPLAGFGFEVPLYKDISWGLEATYTHYPSDKYTYPVGASYRMKTETFDFKLKMTYKI